MRCKQLFRINNGVCNNFIIILIISFIHYMYVFPSFFSLLSLSTIGVVLKEVKPHHSGLQPLPLPTLSAKSWTEK
jgi:hypothetical protein